MGGKIKAGIGERGVGGQGKGENMGRDNTLKTF